MSVVDITQAVLNLMEGDACTWALPHLELLSKGTVPFTGSWDKFIADFTKQFIPLDISEAAWEALKKIWQGKDSVVEYMSKFDQYTTQTGWSDTNHHQCFYNSLNDKIKDVLSYTDQPVTTLTQLCEAASKVDRHIWQCESEKHRGQQNSGAARDPDAMQVDALHQQQQHVTTCDDIRFFFSFLFTFYLSRVLLQSVTWLTAFLFSHDSLGVIHYFLTWLIVLWLMLT